jgi:hypothetical protein
MPIHHIPCAPGAHIGEQIARQFLMHELAHSNGVLLTNYHHPAGNGTQEHDLVRINHPAGNGTQEHDLVRINERGVWAIEVKHWYGCSDADKVYGLHNGHNHDGPVMRVETKAKLVSAALAEAGFSKSSWFMAMTTRLYPMAMTTRLYPSKAPARSNLAVLGTCWLRTARSSRLSARKATTMARLRLVVALFIVPRIVFRARLSPDGCCPIPPPKCVDK